MDITSLIDAAKAIRESSYSPYSNYRVGAALLTTSGQIFCGTNVENASFGLTCCAERNAVFAAVGAGHQTFEVLVIVIEGEKASPCGACLQVLSEFAPELSVIIVNPKGEVLHKRTLDQYLPYAFCGKVLQ